MLSKWLGRESSEYVRHLRAVHIGNPEAALKMVWNRFDECYSSPEVIESALFKKLDSFPRISGKDNLKLRELGDLLMEMLSAKEDGYLPGLAYLDTARGIRPIVEKTAIYLTREMDFSRLKVQRRVWCFLTSFLVLYSVHLQSRQNTQRSQLCFFQ